MALLKTNPPPIPLDEKIRILRDELDAAIDEKARAVKEGMPGVPELVCRNILTRNSECQCAAWLRILESDV
jgi:hypothetical protein